MCEGTCPCWHSTVELTSLVMVVTSSSRGTLAILNTAALSETVIQIVVTLSETVMHNVVTHYLK